MTRPYRRIWLSEQRIFRTRDSVSYALALEKKMSQRWEEGLFFKMVEGARGFLSAPSWEPIKMIKKEYERGITPPREEKWGAEISGFGRRKVRERTVDFLTKSSVAFCFLNRVDLLLWSKRFFQVGRDLCCLVPPSQFLIETTLPPS